MTEQEIPLPTPEEIEVGKQALAKAQYEEMMAHPPSRQAVRKFLNERANGFMSQKMGHLSRSERRRNASIMSKRVAKAALGGSTASL